MRADRDDGNPMQGIVVGILIMLAAAVAVFVGMNIGDWL